MCCHQIKLKCVCLFLQLFWTTWTRSSTTTSCAAESGTAGTSLSWERSSQTTWLTAKPCVRSVRDASAPAAAVAAHYNYNNVLKSAVASPGDRTNVAGSDLSDILPEEIEAEVKLAAEISMGTEVSEQDIGNIRHLCDQVSAFNICM